MRFNITIDVKHIRPYGIDMWVVVFNGQVVAKYWSEQYACAHASELKECYSSVAAH